MDAYIFKNTISTYYTIKFFKKYNGYQIYEILTCTKAWIAYTETYKLYIECNSELSKQSMSLLYVNWKANCFHNHETNFFLKN